MKHRCSAEAGLRAVKRQRLRAGGAVSGFRNGAAVQAGIPPSSDRAIAATIAYTGYLYRRYGRFAAMCGPFRTILAY